MPAARRPGRSRPVPRRACRFRQHRGRGGVEHHPGERPGEVGGLQRLDPHALAGGVDQQPLAVGGRQQHAIVGGAQRERKCARRRRRRAVESDVAFERQPGEALPGGQRLQQFGVGDDERRERGACDRAGDQRFGRLLDHCAQVFDGPARPAGFLRDRDAEDSQFGQPGEHRPPRVGLALLDLADRRGATRSRRRIAGPVAHQGARGKLLVGDGRYHLRGPPRPWLDVTRGRPAPVS